ncbi:MAG: hypothetical protein MJ104_09295 [Lachnospiraceae bacterium]|nr:hypothetical protein [Lachnospiraceae bacterium]
MVEDYKRGMSEEINESFKDAGDIFSNKYRYRHLDYGNDTLIAKYRNELVQWFMNGVSTMPNPMTTVTQEHWYSLYLEKRRLEQHMIYVAYRAFTKVGNPMKKSGDDSTFSYKTDGRFLTCDAAQNTRLSRSFIRNGMEIYREERTARMRYYVISSKTPNETYICLNCGAPTTYEKLLDGCDHCGTKYTVDQFEDKVCALYSNAERLGNREVGSNSLVGIVPAAIMIGAGLIIPCFTLIPSIMQMAYYGNGGPYNKMAFLAIPVLLVIKLALIIGGIVIAVAMQARSNKKGPAASGLIKRYIKRADESFCNEEFLASLDCKLKAVCYANNWSDVQNFVVSDITPMINSLQATVVCEPGAYRMKDFRTDDVYQYLDLTRELFLTMDGQNGVTQEKRIVFVSLRQKRNHKIKHDVSMYKCPKCGASISLVSGGRCDYCGYGLKLEEYDWVITGMNYTDKLE